MWSRNWLFKNSLFISFSLTFLFSCKKDVRYVDLNASGYPKEIGEIVLTQCAVSGCHNSISKDAAAGLDLSTWKNLFEGTRNGVAVIPYFHKQSTMFLFCNTYNDLGVSILPTMPVNAPPLSRDNIIKLQKWIDDGAQRNDGFVMFSDNPGRSKYYIPNQGCDLITVFDQQTSLPMRYVQGGISAAVESPHQIRISPDKKHWYVVFTAGSALQKYSTETDKLVGNINIGFANWNTLAITNDSRYAFVVDWSSVGKVVVVDLLNLTKLIEYPSSLFIFPHGVSLSPDNKNVYITSQRSNFIYKIGIGAPYSITNPNFDDIRISLDGNAPANNSILDPHEIAFTPDGSNYLVTCQKSNEVRIMNTANDALIGVVNTGVYPQEIVIDKQGRFAYVSCTEDTISFPGKRGSIAVIDIQNKSLVKNIYPGHQPHGIGIDEKKNILVVANRNSTSDGPAPHHRSDCDGRNGYVTFIDLKTLEVINGKKIEISVDPYFVAVKQ